MTKIVSSQEKAERRNQNAAWAKYWERLSAAERRAFRESDEKMIAALPFIWEVSFEGDEYARSMGLVFCRDGKMTDQERHAELARAGYRHRAEWMQSHPIEAGRPVNLAENERAAQARAAANAVYQAQRREQEEWFEARRKTPEQWRAEYDRLAGMLTPVNVGDIVYDDDADFNQALEHAIMHRDGCTMRVARNRAWKLIQSDEMEASEFDRAAGRRLVGALMQYRSGAAAPCRAANQDNFMIGDAAAAQIGPVGTPAEAAAEVRRQARRQKRLAIIGRQN